MRKREKRGEDRGGIDNRASRHRSHQTYMRTDVRAERRRRGGRAKHRCPDALSAPYIAIPILAVSVTTLIRTERRGEKEKKKR